MKGQLSTRLVFWIAAPATLLFALVVWSASHRGFERVIAQTETSSRITARYYAAQLESVLGEAAKIPAMIALQLETNPPLTEESLENYLREIVARNPDVYGSCIAFEPESFTPGKRHYAPYFYRKGGAPEFVQLGNPEYDYFRWDWYALPKKAGRPLWSEPYFDEGGGNTVMTTYSMPFFREGKFWGIATIDIAITQLVQQAARISPAKTGYAFIVSQQGRFLAYPDESRIMQSTIQETNPELGRRMVAGEDGFLRTRGPLDGAQSWIAFVPVRQGGLSLALVYPQREVMAQAFDLQKELLALGLIGLAALFVTVTFIARSISRPISTLAQAAQDVAAGRFDLRLDASGATEEVRGLTFAFNKMTRDLQMRMEELRYTTTVKERLEGELTAARNIQMSLLRKAFPAFPDRTEFDIHAMVRPAREVGGDFYDFYFVDEDRLCVLVGDVSGKGIPAALFMAVTKTLLKANSSRTLSAGEIVANVNHELCDEGDTGMFVTLVYAMINIATGEVELSNAGHHPPFWAPANGEVRAVTGEGGIALGLVACLGYPTITLQLQPGDALFFYTDGVTEAVNAQRDFYTVERLAAKLRDCRDLPPLEINRCIAEDVHAFAGGREQSDDISILTIRWLGAKATPRLESQDDPAVARLA